MYVPDENKDNDDDNGNKKKMDQWLPFNILIIFFRVNYMSIPHKKQSVTALIFIVFVYISDFARNGNICIDRMRRLCYT